LPGDFEPGDFVPDDLPGLPGLPGLNGKFAPAAPNPLDVLDAALDAGSSINPSNLPASLNGAFISTSGNNAAKSSASLA
jgi:hypothetical protein